MILHRVSWHVRDLIGCRGTGTRDCLRQIDRVPETRELDTRFADTHGPAHAFDCDFADSACEFIVFDLAVVVVVAAIDLGDL